MTWDEVKELGPLYSIGALDAETMRAIDDFWQDASAEQQREMAEWSELAALLPQALPQTPAPAHLRQHLLNRIAAEAAPVSAATMPSNVLPFTAARRMPSQTSRWLLLAATIALMCTSGYLLWQNRNLTGERDRLLQERGGLLARMTELEGNVDKFVAPSTKVIAMVGDEAPQASAKVFWDTNRQEWVVYVFDLPSLPSDKSYQLWYVTKDAKISAQVFQPDATGRVTLRLRLPKEALAGLAATAVTLEPRGGSPQPTGKFYLKAAI